MYYDYGDGLTLNAEDQKKYKVNVNHISIPSDNSLDGYEVVGYQRTWTDYGTGDDGNRYAVEYWEREEPQADWPQPPHPTELGIRPSDLPSAQPADDLEGYEDWRRLKKLHVSEWSGDDWGTYADMYYRGRETEGSGEDVKALYYEALRHDPETTYEDQLIDWENPARIYKI